MHKPVQLGLLGLASAVLLCGCAVARTAPPAMAAALQPNGEALSRVEADYVAQTARTLYRGATVERAARFVSGPAGAHGACVRSPAGSVTGGDYTLIVLQRRVTDDYISQAADDALILRSASEVAACRARAAEAGFWLPAR
ncbi:hypothetical protein SAMN02745911_0494 [Aureimonas altamirensis DSM 21988]|uniref:Lipoprotein n=1 Tax=Aureimonas altamirensis DSM 21988 TaxID=1121026 RepID=A0ABY1I671_9HYPH|nr:hypothetical protein [Aureimonas altamirensis]SHI55355.1 hypothetical protein SAMN02745911_0494 [Aureimonas altamirensis DSM 21988]